MTLKEFCDKFDDEHQAKFYAVNVLDEEAENNRQPPRVQGWDEMSQALGVN